MKGLLLTATALTVMVFASCSKTTKSETETTDSFKAKIENCTNPDSLAVYVDQAKAYAQKLVDEGKVDQAKKVMETLQPVVEQKAPALAGAFTTVKGLVDKLPSAVDSVKTNAADAVTAVGDTVAATVENAKDAAVQTATDAVNNAKDAATDAVNNAKQAATDKANNAIDAAKKAAIEKVNDVAGAIND